MEHVVDNAGEFRPSTVEGDPGKYAYLRGKWCPKLIIGAGGMRVDPRACPGCMFDSSKWPHVNDSRCSRWKGAA